MEQGIAAKAVGGWDFGCVFKRRGGRGAETFRWCLHGWRDFLNANNATADAKAKRSLYLGKAAPSGTIENVRASAPVPKRWGPVGTDPRCGIKSRKKEFLNRYTRRMWNLRVRYVIASKGRRVVIS